jgi:hypothetical protein
VAVDVSIARNLAGMGSIWFGLTIDKRGIESLADSNWKGDRRSEGDESGKRREKLHVG